MSPYLELVELALGRPTKAEALSQRVLMLARRSGSTQPEDESQRFLLDMTARSPWWVDRIADRSPGAQRVLQGSREPAHVAEADRALDAYVMTACKRRVSTAHRTTKNRRIAIAKMLSMAEAKGQVVEPSAQGSPKDVGMHPDLDANVDHLVRDGMSLLGAVVDEIRRDSPASTYDPRAMLAEMLELALSPESLLERTRAAHADPKEGKKAYDACTRRHARLRREMSSRLQDWINDDRVGVEAGSNALLLLEKFLNRRPNAERSPV